MYDLLLIFIAKTIEVSLGTLRTVFITKGEKKLGSIIGFLEVGMWVIVVSNVITSLHEEPLKGLVYALGFGFGCFVGSIIEEYLAIGNEMLTIIIESDHADYVINILRNMSIGVTTVDAYGKDSQKEILYAVVPRKKKKEVKEALSCIDDQVIIFSADIKKINGGYGLRK